MWWIVVGVVLLPLWVYIIVKLGTIAIYSGRDLFFRSRSEYDDSEPFANGESNNGETRT